MNSISYLDSVLSRSFAPASDRPPSRPSSSSKRSRSHSSLPASRRASSTSPSTPSASSSSLRRWSQEQDEPSRALYSSNTLRRTGSIPASLYPSHALDTDDSDSDSQQTRRARWSGLWGLTGWIDEAIHPGIKNSDSELSYRRTKRMPSLDDLLLSSTAPRRDPARRTASSGLSGRARRDGSSSSTDESQSERRRRSKRHSRLGASASLEEQQLDAWPSQQDSMHTHQDPELMSEKEREDIVEFDGGDFAPEDIDATAPPRERTISQSSADSSWGEGSSVSHEAASTLATAPDSASMLVDEADEQSVDSETLLDAAKGEPDAIEAVAQEDPMSSVVDPAAASATPRKDSATASDTSADAATADDTPTNNRKRPSDSSTSATTTPTASRRASLRRRHAASLGMDPLVSSSNSSLATTDSEQAVDRSLTPSKHRKRRSARSSVTSSARASEAEDSRDGRPVPRNGTVGHSADGATSPRHGAVGSKRKISSTRRAIRRTLAALRDLLLAVLLCPVNCVRYLRRHRAIRVEEAVEAVYDRAQVPILEKNATAYDNDDAAPPGLKRPPSLRFASKTELKRDADKRSSITASRPRTPKPDEKDPDDREPVTEDQAAALGNVWQALASGQRTPSRLLPNPQMVDPMLAHDRKAEPIDVAMAEKEAVMEAERQSRIANGRAARRAAAAAGAAGAGSESPPTQALMPTKVPRAPTSSIIHHSPKILVLDLDETLIHSTSRSPSHYASARGRTTTSGFLGLETAGAFLGLRANDNPRRIRPHMVEVVLDGRSVLYHVYKRPWTDYFLRKVASWYTVVVFTASVQEYADPVIDWLDQGRGLISARLFRESCSFKAGSYVKNLAVVDEDLSKVCLVDNSPASYRLNRANGIPIEGWTHDPNDEALLDLLPVLDSLRFATDVRHILGIRGW
ncbi:related to nuclear envelope protein NEM1 [Sporisorium reilianum SRZ2]|uniref:Related to nuclear envelope protein NEM1 n=1 Tax=Sporisorium reilianum (strain SRZ2) TaxID=999809 RepID=E6ZMY1_SPORE|nr:related to nuclear envelope protein NEM1 [Sporisorium reilianum SRZ2]